MDLFTLVVEDLKKTASCWKKYKVFEFFPKKLILSQKVDFSLGTADQREVLQNSRTEDQRHRKKLTK